MQSGHLHAVRGRGGGTFVADAPPRAEPPDGSCSPTGATAATAAGGRARRRGAGRRARGARARSRRSTSWWPRWPQRLDDFAAYRQADVRFHIGLAEATGSPALVAAMTEAQGAMTDLIRYIAHPPEVLAWSNAQHARLVDCLRAARPGTARADHGRASARHRARPRRAAALTGRAVRSRALEDGGAYLYRRGSGRHRSSTQQQTDDERRLAELGYKQDLQRAWSGFSNFAISFTIISVLAGCFTTYGQAWNNGGPIAISWGWPIICGLILLVAFSMSELVSAYPTAGGIYYWASDARRPALGLVHRLVQPRRPGRRRRLGRLRLRARS